MRILILSTHPPRYSAGFGEDVLSALKDAGHEVDFVSLYEDPLNPSSSRAIARPSKIKVALRKILPKTTVETLGGLIRKILCKKPAPPSYVIFNAGYEIHYPDESSPAFPIERVVDSISGCYDLVITLWWFGMITSATLDALYRKLNAPILIYAIDMAPITGGCFYFKDCRNFCTGCGNCPALASDSPDDFTHRNFMIKQDVYSRVPIGFMGNSWMNDFAVKSGLFSPERVFNVSVIVNDKDFSPGDEMEARRKLGLLPQRKVVMLARSSVEPRKGARHIIEGIRNLWKTLSEAEREEIEIVTLGDSMIHDALSAEGINSVWLGKIDRTGLITAYRSASFFLSASEDDAGPSMVNQSMMCGTPVIAFDNGTAMDVIENGRTGFKSISVTSVAFSELLREAWELSRQTQKYIDMRTAARAKALDVNSPASVAEKIKEAYLKLSDYDRGK